MTYLFLIQGEGRGHLTQALTLKEKLENHGHKIVAVVVSSNNGSPLPGFFQNQIKALLLQIASPHFIVDKQGQGIKLAATFWHSLKGLPQYRQSYRTIKKLIAQYQPDALVSFYEPLAGIYHRLSGDARPLFCLGHQYFVNHPDFKFPSGQWLSRQAFKSYNYLTTSRRSHKIALSFSAASDLPNKRLMVCPPLIRHTVKKQIPSTSDFLLVYILNAGYSTKIIDWSKAHPGIKIEAFWNNPSAEETKINDDLTFNHLSGDRFIELLASCRAYASTGGFDSIAEAAYLQKPILMNPTKNHFEQQCNAVDAARVGLALATDDFNLSLIADAGSSKTKTHSAEALRRFKEWVDAYDDKIVSLLEK